jgi:hypothetical protein
MQADDARPAEGVVWGGDKVSCTEEVVADRDRHIEVLREVIDAYYTSFRALPGLVGLGAAPIYANGENTGKVGIEVMIDSELPPEQFESLMIPSEIEGCKVFIRRGHPVPAGGGS